MQDIIHGFIQYLKEREFAANTILAYETDIAQFLSYYSDKDLDSISTEDVIGYRKYLENGNEQSTVLRKLYALKNFFCSLDKECFVKLFKIQEPYFLDNVFTNSDVKMMIDCARSRYDYRAVALINTLYLTGVRVSELKQIFISDVDLNSKMILGKGGKYRRIFFPERLNAIWR